MVVAGKQDGRALLSDALDATALARLTADLLAVRGHTNIRITDGPGDGGRDVHSLTPHGKKHLAQCKFHASRDATCSSAAVSELPMAMIKFGYTEGLFVTNAKISPQGKREYIDSFPGVQLEFADGDVLAREVTGDPLLRALWFDGHTIERVNTSVTLPVLVRRHSDDAPLAPFKMWDHPNVTPVTAFLSERYPRLRFSLDSALTDSHLFEPYRMPEPLAAEESVPRLLHTTDVLIAGAPSLSELEKLLSDVGRAFVLWLSDISIGLTARVGKPELTVLAGERQGSKVEIAIEPLSTVQSESWCASELDWFASEPETGWSALTDARQTEGDWIRLFSAELDCAMAYEIRSRISERDRRSSFAHREITQRGWMRSIFALVPHGVDWAEVGVNPPDETIKWPWDGRELCGWFHWSILGGLVALRSVAEPWDMPDEDAEATRLHDIRSKVEAFSGATVVDAGMARHMVALVGADPLAEREFITYRTAEVTHYLETLPSPINPKGRQFRVTAAWRAEVDVAVASEALKGVTARFGDLAMRIVKCERYREFVVCEAGFDCDAALPTPVILSDSRCCIEALLKDAEKLLGASARRATREYWRERHGVLLGTSPRSSDKIYAWRTDSRGNATPVSTREFLGEADLDEAE